MDAPLVLDDIELEKRSDSLVFEIKRSDGTALTEAEYQALRQPYQPFPGPSPSVDHELQARLTRPYKICAEGDSWVNILWPISKVKGFNESFVDIIEGDRRCFVNNIGWPGDEFSDIVAKEQYKAPIQSGIFGFFILSGGGNDFLGGRSLARFVKPFSAGGGASDPWAYVRKDNLKAIFAEVAAGYQRIIDNVQAWSRNTQILLHGYDHAIPRPGGPWMGTPFSALGYNASDPIAAAIIRVVVDEFYGLLADFDRRESGVHLINARGCCTGHWHDELHPDKSAAIKIAQKYLAKMEEITPVA
ncbi:hypothetical protein HFO09_29820 [Rhizobium laguerreae]|uniref:hypothetical protein n=1 Tax=Rhizobium laguerreae TaxID=1076926 RepID=UPI001C911C77|nr:hypothetical protein [Rhizobium laguerreae]MBY3258708.1 hypothetical protein [Rhizobium laguerreae]MBY3286545.1 hypothetical protein [Rhizobium laguerreae]MBY3293208.1 hypothetical protein [Rhizobium laguerreae]